MNKHSNWLREKEGKFISYTKLVIVLNLYVSLKEKSPIAFHSRYLYSLAHGNHTFSSIECKLVTVRNSIKSQQLTHCSSAFFLFRIFHYTMKERINSCPETRLKAEVNEVLRFSGDEKSRILHRNCHGESSAIVRFAFKLMSSQTAGCFAKSSDQRTTLLNIKLI